MNLNPRFTNLFFARLVLFMAFCALLVGAIFMWTGSMRAQQSGGSRALVRHGFAMNGRIEGSVQQLTAENTTINGGGVLNGDLFVPGTPTVREAGQPTFAGIVQGSGAAQPTTYQITLNGNAQLGHLITRTDPVAMPTVDTPPAATGTRDVTLNSPTQSAGDFATLRDLTLDGNVGMVAVPPGSYRRFTANGNTGFIFGVAGSSQPAVYNLNSLTLNGGSQLQIAGPVVLTTATALALHSTIGSATNPLWLNLKVAAGDVTLNSGSTLYGVVTTPSGTITINGNSQLIGNVKCDRLTLNANGLLRVISGDTTPPVLTIQQPAEGSITNAPQVTVSGTFSDEDQTTIKVNGVTATIQGNNFTASVPIVEGPNALLVAATDAAGNKTELTRNVVRDATVPSIVISQPTEATVTKDTQVTVTGTYSDNTATTISVNGTAATISGSTFTAVVTIEEGANALIVTATDAAGNLTEVTRNVVRDTSAPTLAIDQPTADTLTKNSPVTVTGTFNDTTTTIIKVSNVEATIVGNTFAAAVPLVEGSNVLHVTATDKAGNITELDRSITLDTIAPVLTMQSPADGTLTAAADIIVSGTLSDAHEVSVTVNSVPATITQNSYTATVPLSEGRMLLIATAVDAAGNETAVEHKITRAAALTLNVQEPLEGQLADSGEIRVAGTVTGTDVQVSVNGQPITMAGGIVFGGYTTLAEGTHTVTITATDVLGRTEQIVRNVIVDTTPPTISDVLPTSNQLVSETTTTISGRVSDATAVTVKVNGVDASIGGGGVFTVPNFAVSEGENAVRVEAIDALGHNTLFDLVFLGKDRTAPTTVVLFPVPAETRLQSQQVEGRAEPGTVVNITGGLQAVTAEVADGTGLFFATVNLAMGNNTLTVTNVDKDGNVSAPVTLTVRSDPSLTRPLGQAIQIHISVNDAQKGLIGQELPRPLIARVTDVAGNEVAGVPVTFTAVEGGGSFVGGNNQFVSVTDAQGHASARYIGGATPGFQYVRADFSNNLSKPVSFSAELLRAAPGAQTTASGIVMDQNLRALPNVLVRLGGQQTRTGIDGRFLMQNVASGPHQVLELIGRDQIQFPGRWPNISYDFDVLAGVDNNLGRPLFLPRVNAGVAMPLDANNIITSDTVYELPAVGGLPPIRVTAKAGTHVSFPPDVTDKRLSVTRIPVNRTPMTLEEGRAASLYISVQPSGAIFEPALEISFPNLDHLPANSEVLLMSFDHDAGRYVQMGTGHVSADASVVKSDPGSGIRVGAWHALPPDPPQKESTILSYVQVEGNPAFEGKDVQVTNGTIMGVRVVEYSHASNASGQLSRILLRALVVQPGDAPPVVEAEYVQTKAAKPKLEIDAGAFDYKTKELFIAEDKEIKLTATAVGGLPGSTYTTTCKGNDTKKVTVVCEPNSGAITITGKPVFVGSNYDNNAGETSFEIEMKGTQGGNTNNPDKAKIKVSLVKVRYKEDKPNSGFDDPIRGQVQDPSGVQFDGSNNFTADRFKEDQHNKVNKTKDPWLTTVVGFNQGNQTAKYEVKPDKAAEHLKFESDAVAKADVTADIQNKKLTVTGKVSTGTNTSGADETFVKAKLDSYKAETFEVGKLNVVVRKKVDVKLAFYFLKNPADGHEARLDPDGLDRYLQRINNVLTPQTGIVYTKFRVYHWETNKNFNFTPTATNNPARLTRDLTDVVSALDWIYIASGKAADANVPGLRGAAQAKLCDADADREIYVVWEFETGEIKPPTTDIVGAFQDAHGTVILDKEDTDNTLTHELGHSLYIRPQDPQYRYFNCLHGRATCALDPPHSNVQRELMFATNSGRGGLYIPKADVDQAIQFTTNSDWFKGGIRKRAC